MIGIKIGRMYGRSGLDRFKKAESVEPFSVTTNSASKLTHQPASKAAVSHSQTSVQQNHYQSQLITQQKPVGTEVVPSQNVTQIGSGQSTWHPPDWAIEPRPGVFHLDVLKDGEVLDQINLSKRKHIFGRQFHTCDIVLDHQSVSRQHAAVVPHKNGSIYVIDLGSAHGTFVANERLTKDSPMELEVGQSLRFAASTRVYVLRKNNAALFPPPQTTEINVPPPPDPSDEEAVLAYNTFLNRHGLPKPGTITNSSDAPKSEHRDDEKQMERTAKRIRRIRVAFRDQVGGELVEVVGVSDGADVDTDPGPVGVKEGSLVGKYESLVQITVIPKGKESVSAKEVSISQSGVTAKLQQVLNKVKSPTKGGIYDDLYGDSLPPKVASGWAYSKSGTGQEGSANDNEGQAKNSSSGKTDGNSSKVDDDSDDDLFG